MSSFRNKLRNGIVKPFLYVRDIYKSLHLLKFLGPSVFNWIVLLGTGIEGKRRDGEAGILFKVSRGLLPVNLFTLKFASSLTAFCECIGKKLSHFSKS